MELTKLQIEEELCKQFENGMSMKSMLELVLNSAMKCERDVFLESDSESGNKGNGYRPVRAMGVGAMLELRVPRDRAGVFKPVILGIIRSQEEEAVYLYTRLYALGLSTRDIAEITSDIYGKHMCANEISKLNVRLYEEAKAWRERKLASMYKAVYIDVIQVKVNDGGVDNNAFYVALGVKEDGTRDVLMIESRPTESATGWKESLRSLRARGVEHIGYVIADGLAGLDEAVGEVFPRSKFQRCVVHIERNIMSNVKMKDKGEVLGEFKESLAMNDCIDTQEACMARLTEFAKKWSATCPYFKKWTPEFLSMMTQFKNAHFSLWRHLYTTNSSERLNRSFRKTLKNRCHLPSTDAVLYLMYSVAKEKEEKSLKYEIKAFNLLKI